MKIPTNHDEQEAFSKELQCTFIIDLSTMSEKLCRGNTLIYEAPLGNCLSHFLRDDMDTFALKHASAINEDINSILSDVNSHLMPNSTYNDDEWRIISEILGFDCTESLEKALPLDEDPRLTSYDDVTWYSNKLSIYSGIFTDYKPDNSDHKLKGDILRAIFLEYIDKLDCDPVYRDMGFFCHIFGNNPYYSSFTTAKIYDYFSFDNSQYTASEILADMRSAYVDIMQSGSSYPVEHCTEMCVFTLEFIIKNNLHIRKCQNCGQYFVPKKRADELYCDNPSPQDATKTCKQYGTSHLWYDKLKNDPLMIKCKNVYNAKYARFSRNLDVTAYAVNFEEFKRDSLEWKKRYKTGECTAEEFDAWLEEQKARKT